MQKFSFRLQKVLEYETQLRDIESRKLQMLMSERATIDRRISDLEDAVQREEDAVQSRKMLSSIDLTQMGNFMVTARARRRDLFRERSAVEKRIVAQRETVLQQEQKVELMTRMREMRWQEWQRQAANEEEQTATELFLAGKARAAAQSAATGVTAKSGERS